jgi:hypothetical protein
MIFIICLVFVLLFCMSCSLFCVFCAVVLFLIMHVVAAFLFVYKFTNHCYQVETKLQLISHNIQDLLLVVEHMLLTSRTNFGKLGAGSENELKCSPRQRVLCRHTNISPYALSLYVYTKRKYRYDNVYIKPICPKARCNSLA